MSSAGLSLQQLPIKTHVLITMYRSPLVGPYITTWHPDISLVHKPPTFSACGMQKWSLHSKETASGQGHLLWGLLPLPTSHQPLCGAAHTVFQSHGESRALYLIKRTTWPQRTDSLN